MARFKGNSEIVSEIPNISPEIWTCYNTPSGYKTLLDMYTVTKRLDPATKTLLQDTAKYMCIIVHVSDCFQSTATLLYSKISYKYISWLETKRFGTISCKHVSLDTWKPPWLQTLQLFQVPKRQALLVRCLPWRLIRAVFRTVFCIYTYHGDLLSAYAKPWVVPILQGSFLSLY